MDKTYTIYQSLVNINDGKYDSMSKLLHTVLENIQLFDSATSQQSAIN